MRHAALRDDIPRAALALTALGGHAEFELNFVESHAGADVACDFSVGDPATDANDHGRRAALGWLVEEDLIINTNSSHLQ